MAKSKVTPKNLPLVWLKLTAYVADNYASDQCKYFCAEYFCADLDKFLNELSYQDAFGTEGQCDPRGDQRF